MELQDPSFADEFKVPPEYAVLIFDVRRASASFPFQIHRRKMLVEAELVTFSSACFECVDDVPDEVQYGIVANLPEIFSSHLHGLSKVAAVGFCAKVPPHLLSLLPCCVHLSPYIGPRAPTLCSARALKARWQSGRRHHVGHVGGDVTDAGAIGDWW